MPTTKLLTTVKLNVSSKVPVVVDWVNKYCVVPGFTVQVKITELLSLRLPIKSLTAFIRQMIMLHAFGGCKKRKERKKERKKETDQLGRC